MKAVKILGKIIILACALMAIVSLFQHRGVIVFLSFASGIILGFVIFVSGYVKTWLG